MSCEWLGWGVFVCACFFWLGCCSFFWLFGDVYRRLCFICAADCMFFFKYFYYMVVSMT